MKNLLRKLALGLLLISFLGGAARAEGRIATVDLRKVFDGYYKKKQAEALIKDRSDNMEKEGKAMLDDYKKAKDDYQTLQASASEPAISQEQRDKRNKLAMDKLQQVKELEETITQYERTARTTIGEQSQRMRANILTEIRNVVNSKARAGNFALVIDTAAESAAGTPFVMFSNNENDITDAVILQLNETAPANLPPPDETTAPKSDQKKDETTSGKK